MANKLLCIISREELRDLILVQELTIKSIAKKYNVCHTTVSKAVKIINVTRSNENKLLQKVSKEEIEDLLYNKFMSPKGIGKLYKVDGDTVFRALDILKIELDKSIWKSGTSCRQRKLMFEGATLTDRQQQILVGNLLGDGYMQKIKVNKTSNFVISQSEAHKEYIEWLHSEFKPFSGNIRSQVVFLETFNKYYTKYEFSTVHLPIFTKYRKLFYPNEKKAIPKSIVDLLTELSLAIWYMDDGSNNKVSRYSDLCTQGFTTEDVELLIEVLYKKFNVKSHMVYAEGKTELHPVIRIAATEGYSIFHSIVDPYLLPCFSYKAGREKKPPKVTEDDIRKIRKLFSEGLKYIDIATMFKVNKSTIQNIILGRSFKNVS